MNDTGNNTPGEWVWDPYSTTTTEYAQDIVELRNKVHALRARGIFQDFEHKQTFLRDWGEMQKRLGSLLLIILGDEDSAGNYTDGQYLSLLGQQARLKMQDLLDHYSDIKILPPERYRWSEEYEGEESHDE